MYESELFEQLAEFTPNPDQPFPLPLPLPEPLPRPIPLPFPWPFPLHVSGLYESIQSISLRPPSPPLIIGRQELRLDVDGRYPQMIASGTHFGFFFNSQTHWIANLTASGPNKWTGNIWYKDGSFAYTHVEIEATPSFILSQQSATVTFSGGGAANLVRTYKYKSAYFHPVEFEFDTVEGTTAVTTVQTHAHPNRPATLPNENLSIETVFRRSGFNVKKSGGDNIIPIAGAGRNGRWSDMEMHDAMQTYWSRFADRPQWSMWVLFASLHEQGTSLGGIMFDDIGPNHRQGTAIFNDSFISNAPAGDANPAAWVQRMRFWTAVHEMGHGFNLAHSWQKSLVYQGNGPWIPLADEPEARSFMNYPYNVSGGQTAFFSNFEYRFSDAELLFMRHAPYRFVQMGNANWFDHHGFQGANVSPEPAFKLELRVNRKTALFEFLEPVVLELKLTNLSSQPQLIEDHLLSTLDHMTVILKKDKQPARQFAPYAQYCWKPTIKALMPGESVYESLFVSAGKNGWDIAEPGYYTIQVALHLEGEDVVSNALRVRVAPPRGYEEEFLAQDFFSDAVGRILTFDGSRFLTQGNDTLQEVTERLSDRKVAIHARVALGNPLMQEYKQLIAKDVQPASLANSKLIAITPPDESEANKQLHQALMDDMSEAAQTLGHIDYKDYVDRYSDWLAQQGEVQEAVKLQNNLYQTLSNRRVLGRVLQDVKERGDRYQQQQ